MRKRVFGKKLSRSSGARRALLRSQVRAMVLHGKIKTTKAKAKSTQRFLQKIINLAKDDSLAKRRQVLAKLGNDRKTTDTLFKKVAPLFEDRVGGYTRLTLLTKRKGDGAEMAILTWSKDLSEGKKKKKGKKKKAKDKTTKKGKK